MREKLSPCASEAIKSRVIRARQRLDRQVTPLVPLDFELIALAVQAVCLATGVPFVDDVRVSSRVNTLRNMAILLATDLVGREVDSVAIVIRASREIEKAVQRSAHFRLEPMGRKA